MRRYPLLVIAWLLLVALRSTVLQADADPREVAAAFFKGVYACNPSAVEELASDQIVVTYPIFESLFGTPVIRGRAAVRRFAEGFCSRWAEAKVTIHEAIADEGKVVLVWSFSARNVGSAREDTPPTGERTRWGGITLYYFDSHGKITAEIGEESEPGPIERAAIASPESGVRRIPIETPSGSFEVWTRRVGENPAIKVLLLHGGPGATHEYLLNFEDHLPTAGVELYFYDQLGSFHSDQPEDPSLWTLERFVDEVEQVRVALGLDSSNFYLFGQSWGGLLALEYALEHQANLKGLVISNNMSSYPAYNDYAANVLMPAMDPSVLAEIKALEAAEAFDDPRYMELLVEHHYVDHVLRRPIDQWPDDVNAAFEHLNTDIYIPLQGPSELGVSGQLEAWDRSADLGRLAVPTLIIGATHDTMDPEHMEWMAGAVANGRFLLCPAGSHMAHIDDETVYFDGLIRFLHDVDNGNF